MGTPYLKGREGESAQERRDRWYRNMRVKRIATGKGSDAGGYTCSAYYSQRNQRGWPGSHDRNGRVRPGWERNEYREAFFEVFADDE